jgi:hypothetical protein
VRLAAAIALALALAAPAEAAEAIGHSAVTAGPVLAGGGLMLGRRVLARGRIAGFDLGPNRAVWAAGPPAGRQRIAFERL